MSNSGTATTAQPPPAASAVMEFVSSRGLAPDETESPCPVSKMEIPVQQFQEYIDSMAEDGPAQGSMPADESTDLSSDPGEEEVVVCRLHSRSMFSVRVGLNSTFLNAIIDTAAEVTIISDRVHNILNPKPPKIKEVTLNTAGRDMKMKGIVAGPVEVKLGSKTFMERVYVAPIEDDMLLGIDFLRRHKVDICIPESRLLVEGEEIPMAFGSESQPPKVARVLVNKTTLIPPNSVKKVPCRMTEPLEQFVVEPSPGLNALMPRTIHSPGPEAELFVINPTSQNVRLKRNRQIGNAEEVAAVMDIPAVDAGENLSVSEVAVNSDIVVPEHLQELLEKSTEHLDEHEQTQLKGLLIEFQGVFARDEFDLGNFTSIEHHIETERAKPVKSKMRRTPLGFAQEEKAHLDRMEAAGVIQPSVSEWASAPVLVRKRDGGVRWCVDYRGLNAATRKDVYPLPNIEECMDTLAGNEWFSKLDANAAYWQVRIAEGDRKKTAFITRYGLYEFVRMGFGLCNAPATFSRVMNLVLRGLNWNVALAFLDDILVLGKTFDDHIANLRQVLQRFQDFQLKLKPRKCALFQHRVEFLGRSIDRGGMQLKEENIKSVEDWPAPKNTKQVEQFLGLVNYHRIFLKDYAAVAAPLYGITGKNKFTWGTEQQQAFEEIKRLLTSAPVLALPNAHDPFILDTDASNTAIGAELIQVQNGQERVVAYGSLSLSPEQRRYCVTRRELLAVIKFTRQYRHYLLGRPFTVRTDHSSLTWLLNFKEPQGQIARWLEEISQYTMTVEHRAGKEHLNADALSRVPEKGSACPDFRLGFQPGDLPCGGCNYCQKAHQNWAHFVTTVDDVVPLAVRPKQVRAANLHSEDESIPDSFTITRLAVMSTCDGLGMLVDGDDSVDCFVTSDAVQSESVSSQHFREEQEKDGQLAHLRNWLTSQEEPQEGTIMLWGPVEKNLWLNRELFVLEDGILWKTMDDKRFLVVPKSLQSKVMEMNHDIPTAGHAGKDKTIAKIKTRYFWYRMTKDIRNYISSCAACNQNKKAVKQGRCPMTNYHAGLPMEKVHLDFIGPLPKSTQGNEHILMMVDQFTKWVECVPLPSQTAEATALAAVGEFFCRFGCPLQIVTDQGRNFESKLFSNVCKVLQIHKSKTTPYRPSANGQVERFNRTLMDAVRCYVGKAQNQWDKHLQHIAGALRSTVNRSTGFTPNMLMLGREVNQPADLVFPLPASARQPSTPDDYCAEMAQAIEKAHEAARTTLRSTQKRMKRDYDLKVRTREFNEGDWVYLLDTASIKGKCKKLSPPWKGPALITKKLSPYLYRIKYRNTIFTMNHDRLKKCTDRVVPEDHGKAKKGKSGVYCLCRKPDDGSFMIQCDTCNEWFHGRCVHIPPEDGMAMDKYACPLCQQK